MGTSSVVSLALSAGFHFIVLALILMSCIHYLRKGLRSTRPRRLYWIAGVYAFGAIVVVLSFVESLYDSVACHMAMALATGVFMLLVVTIPCGIRFFNKRGVRPFRNLLFIGLGLFSFYNAFQWYKFL